ncbi:MAG: sialate O-acetylesterase, partial [Planctomycetaceae bacterium]
MSVAASDAFRQTQRMKTYHRLPALFLLLTATAIAEEPTHVFLLIGQSNMAGRAQIEEVDTAPIDDVFLWNTVEQAWEPAKPPYNLYSPHRKAAGMQRLNCGPSFAREYRRLFPKAKIGIVCVARGGTSIKKWRKGAEEPWPLYDTAVATTKAALADGDGVLKGILWHQGESNSGRAAAYPRLLARLAKNLRTDFRQPKLPFVYGQIGRWRDSAFAFNRMIAEQPTLIPNTACVSAIGLTAFDKAHFDSPSQRELGKRYARAIARVLASSKPLSIQSLGTFANPKTLPRTILSGSFKLSAKISLERLDGTAASVWFGNALNLGFDSRSGHLFAEGPAVGRTTMLQPSADLITPGKPFKLTVTRDSDGKTSFVINTTKVLETTRLPEPLSITCRPHRNVMSVGPIQLSGENLSPPAAALAFQTNRVPILIGQDNKLATLSLHSPQAIDITGLDFDLAGADALTSLVLQDAEGNQIRLKGEPNAATTLRVEPGPSQLTIKASVKANANLRQPLLLKIRGIKLADSSVIDPDEPHEFATQRLAVSIHKQGENDCHTTRIPGIVRTNDGTLLGVYDLRYNSRRDLQEHIDIGLSRSTDNGQTWESPRPIMDMGQFGGKPEKENGCSDPNILVDRKTGEIFVSAVWTHGKPNTHQWQGRGSEPGFSLDKTAQFMMVRSSDDGKTWTKPTNLTRDLKRESWWLFAPAPGNGITLTDGTLVMPTQGRDDNGYPFSNLMHSKDHGETWTVSPAARDNTTECSVAELSDGSLMLNMRDNRNRSDKS